MMNLTSKERANPHSPSFERSGNEGLTISRL